MQLKRKAHFEISQIQRVNRQSLCFGSHWLKYNFFIKHSLIGGLSFLPKLRIISQFLLKKMCLIQDYIIELAFSPRFVLYQDAISMVPGQALQLI